MVLADLQKNTIQLLPDAQNDAGDVRMFFGVLKRGALLPAWGTRQRERDLRDIYRADYNWMIQGAFAGIMKKIASAPWKITGPDAMSSADAKYWRARFKAARFGREAQTARPDIEYWQEVLRQADFGRGWTSFVLKGVDYLRHDAGWYWELIAPGDPSKPPTGAVQGIAHLDSLRCLPTGDPEYPVVYQDKTNQLHLLHRTRVVQLVDMPDGDEYRPGYGLCALSRACSIAAREMLMGRYIESALDDKPKPGVVISNLNRSERDRAFAEYRREQGNDDRAEWGRTVWFNSPDPQFPVQMEFKAFTDAPEQFDFNTYTLLDVNALALALGVDVQELWQLTGGNLGSGEQSDILNQKSRGKTLGTLYASIERVMNDILPEAYTFGFELKDDAETIQAAQIANLWADVAGKLRADMDTNELRQMLANQIEAVKDAITDENGEIRRVDDVDVQPQEQIANDSDGTPDAEPANGTGNGRVDAELGRRGLHSDKAIQATRLDFENAFADLLNAFINTKTLNRIRFGIGARDLLRRYGRQAFFDGLAEAGILDADMDEADRNTFTRWLADQSFYVTQFGDSAKTLTAIDADSRAVMWFNKSLMPMFQYGQMSADKNGLYLWVYGDTEHCGDCMRLNGQKHRLKDWYKKGWLPKASRLECKGFLCRCALVRTTGKAIGRF